MIVIDKILTSFPEGTYCTREIVLFNNELSASFYTMQSWYSNFAGRVVINNSGKIVKIEKGYKDNIEEIELELKGEILDLSFFSKHGKAYIYDTYSPSKIICGELRGNNVYLYDEDNYADYLPSYDLVNIDNEMAHMGEKQNLDYFIELVNKLMLDKRLGATYYKSYSDNKLKTYFTFYDINNKENKIDLSLWEFFDYVLDIHTYKENNHNYVRLTDYKIENLGFEVVSKIISDWLDNKINDYAILLEAIDVDYDPQDVRRYYFNKINDDEYTVKIGYSNVYYSRDPKRPYTYHFNLKDKNVVCTDNNRKSKRIEGLVSIFNDRIKVLAKDR